MATLNDMRVLVVDDNAQMRRLLAQMLLAVGFRVIREANNASEAAAVFQTVGADIVIIDWKMAPIDGIALTRAIRRGETPANPCTPVVMLTAHTEGSRVAAARDAGVNGFVKKPVSAQMLFDRVANALTDTRTYVRTADFFGPDRRRLSIADYAGPLRRASDHAAPQDTLDLDDIRLSA